MTTTRPKRWLVCGVAPLALAACSSGGDDTTGVASLDGEVAAAAADGTDAAAAEDADGGAAPTLEEAEAQMLDFASCMRDAGVDIGDPVVDADGNITFGGLGPGGGGEGGRPEGVREAFDSCGELLDGVQLGGRRGDVDRTELEDSLLEFAQCMRDEGVDMDDPDFSNFDEPGEGGGPGAGGGPFGAIDRDDPTVEAATDVCGDLLAGIGRGPGAGDPAEGGGA